MMLKSGVLSLLVLVCATSCIKLPAQTKAASVRVNLPSGWVEKTPTLSKVIQFGVNQDAHCYFELIAEPKADFPKRVNLLEYGKRVQRNVRNTSKLTSRGETDLRRIASAAFRSWSTR